MPGDMTIFDKIKAKEIPANIVYEDADILAFRDINPQAPTHVLVIPQKRIRSFAGLPQASATEVGLLMQGVAKVAKLLGLEESGYRIIFNHGSDGQQTVDYIHAHILGGRPMRWPPG